MSAETTSTLFVYTRDRSGNFWVYDGALYHRFLWNAEGVWFIRSQAYLPEYSSGICLVFNLLQRQYLEIEAGRYGISLGFCQTEEDCKSYAVQLHQNQYVFDCTYPGGFFIMQG